MMYFEISGHENPKKLKKASTVSGILGFIFTLFAAYILMLGPHKTIFSIDSWMHWIISSSKNEQFFLICFLPIYLSLLIFGSAAFGWFLGRKIPYWFSSFLSHKHI